MRKKIAIIPARSGSKGLPNKNILNICGKPMLAFTIEAAQKSNQFSKIIVSTDSPVYKEIAENYGALADMRRSALAGDDATTYMVVEDLLGRLRTDMDYFVLLQPTSPMRTDRHIQEACELFEKNMRQFDFLVSMQEAKFPAVLVKPIGDDQSLQYFNTDFSAYKRQTYQEYSPNGALYMAKPEAYLRQKHFFGKRSLAYIMDKPDSVDVDDEIDYALVCLLMQKRFGQKQARV